VVYENNKYKCIVSVTKTGFMEIVINVKIPLISVSSAINHYTLLSLVGNKDLIKKLIDYEQICQTEK